MVLVPEAQEDLQKPDLAQKTDKNEKDLGIVNVGSLPTDDTVFENTNRYPMRDAPVPLASVDEIICSQSELIRRLSDALPLSTQEFNDFIFPSIRRFASFVHLLPASNNHHHKGRGGLFRHSLEVALYTVNTAKGHIFEQNQVPSAVYYSKGRWFVACALAAMLHDIGKTLLNVIVTGNDGKLLWYPMVEGLHEWGVRNNLSEYYLIWKKEDSHYELHESMGATLAQSIIDKATLQYIAEANSQLLLREFLEALSGIKRSGALIAQLVSNADILSTKEDFRFVSLDNKASNGVDTPLTSIIEDIIVDLVEREIWIPNRWGKGDTVIPALWVTDEGTFLHWPVAVRDIVTQLNQRGVKAIPRDPLTLAEKLCEGGLCELLHPDVCAEVFWQVLPMVTVQPKIEEQIDPVTNEPKIAFLNEKGDPYQYHFLQCVKLVNPQRLFAHKAQPIKEIAVVISLPVSLDKINIWQSKTKMQPPQTQMEESDFTADLLDEAVRVKESEKKTDVFDEFGNPLPFMPILGEDQWMDIERANNHAAFENISYDELVKEYEKQFVRIPAGEIQTVEQHATEEVSTENQQDPVNEKEQSFFEVPDLPGLGTQIAVTQCLCPANATTLKENDVAENSLSVEQKEKLTDTPLSEEDEVLLQEELQDALAQESVTETEQELDMPEAKVHEDPQPKLATSAFSPAVSVKNFEKPRKTSKNLSLLSPADHVAQKNDPKASEKNLSEQCSRLTQCENEVNTVEKVPGKTNTLVQGLLPTGILVHRKAIESSKEKIVSDMPSKSVGVKKTQPNRNTTTKTNPPSMPESVINHPEYAIRKEPSTLEKRKNNSLGETKKDSSLVKENRSSSINDDYELSRSLYKSIVKAIILQLKEGKGNLICLFHSDGEIRSCSSQKIREFFLSKSLDWLGFVEFVQKLSGELKFNDEQQRFFIKKGDEGQ